MIRYVGLFRCLQDDHWQVTFPDLPGCLARGETFQEAYESARDALADELIAADGPPRPRTTLEIILDARKDPALGRALVGAVMHLVPFEDPRDPVAAVPRNLGAPPLRDAVAAQLPE